MMTNYRIAGAKVFLNYKWSGTLFVERIPYKEPPPFYPGIPFYFEYFFLKKTKTHA